MTDVHTNCIRLLGYLMLSRAILSLSKTHSLTEVSMFVVLFTGISILYLQHRTKIAEQKSNKYE